MCADDKRDASVSSCAFVLARLRDGDEGAALEIFLRFRDRLIALARERLGSRLRAKLDPEDVLQSVLRSFFTRHRAARVEAQTWESLWNLLALMTVRKCANQVKRYRSARRDVKRELRFDVEGKGWEALARDPTPSHTAAVMETLERLVRALAERDHEVLVLHLEGYTVPETAARIGRAERTVRRALERVRREIEKLDLEGIESAGGRAER